jgi:hypothetical protein
MRRNILIGKLKEKEYSIKIVHIKMDINCSYKKIER